jgi:LacI family transcriptional regulator
MSRSDHEEQSRRPTMADVGRLAGVSATTVSFVLNEKSGQTISPQTRQRVLAAVAQLDYRPNKQARALRMRHTATIGFVTDELDVDPFAGATILGAHEVAWEHGSLLLVVNAARDPQVMRQAIDDLVDRPVDAIVLAVVGTRRVQVPDALKGVPAVLVNGFANRPLPAVLPDEETGGRTAAQAVLDAGHRRIAYLTGPPASWATRARLRGFETALRAAGVARDDVSVREGNFRADSGYDLARDLLTRRAQDRPTAILCGNDRMALGVYLAAGEAGLRVPDDLSVVGYDDQVDLASDVRPALTTVRIPYRELGRWAARQVVDGVVGELPARTYLPCPLVPRGSVAPPVAGAL